MAEEQNSAQQSTSGAQEHHHHHHHHHHDSAISTNDSLFGELKEYNNANKNSKRRVDSTTRFRREMHKRGLRNKLLTKALRYLLIAVVIVLVLCIYFAYRIDV